MDAARGRLLRPDDEAAVVVSAAFWRTVLRANERAFGRDLIVDGRKTRIVGILPQDFWFYSRGISVWTVLDLSAQQPGATWAAVARLRAGADLLDAEQELRRIDPEYDNSRPKSYLEQRFGREEERRFAPIRDGLRFALRWYTFILSLAFGAILGRVFLDVRKYPLFAAFFVAKTGLLLFVVAVGAIEVSAAARGDINAGTGHGLEWLFAIASGLSIWWSTRDQHLRCRVCLRRLSMPVRFGTWSHPMLDPVSTETVCGSGHGLLYISEPPGSSTAQPEHWMELDPSWRGLFAKSH